MTSTITQTGNVKPVVRHDDLIRSSWERALKFGLNPDAVEVNQLIEADIEIGELAHAATKIITATAGSLDDTNTWISFANAQGAISYQWAATDSFRKALGRVSVGQGAVIDEQAVGPSGIAIALASGQPVVVSGDEHFNPYWRKLVCAASPVVHPLTQEVVGAVNVTCLAEEENKHLRIVLKTVVNGFQQILGLGMHSQQRRLLDAHLQTKHVTKCPVITVDSNTMIDEKDLENQNLTHRIVRTFIHDLRPDAREGRLPNGCRVTVVRHAGSGGEEFFSLVFDPLEIYAVASNRQFGSVVPIKDYPQLKLLERAERDTIVSTLTSVHGNKSLAAAMLGISRGTLYERIKRFNLAEPEVVQ